MPTVYDVADYFLWKASETGELLTNLKLQKLVFYAQAFHLAVFDKPLFQDDFEAWVYGPVCPTLYREYKEFGWNPICRDSINKLNFTPDAEELLEEISDLFLGESAYNLQRRTHREDPWANARQGLPPDTPSHNIISKETMKKYYKQFIVEEN
ncbi:MAG: SocA family protein [Deltaproteobacteria bacterium]|nr:SocA family protein [Deltaproteobacteria bacterium]